MNAPKLYNYIPNDEIMHRGHVVKGLCDYEDKVIFINPRLSDRERLITIVHEMLHYIFPKRSEKWVEKNGVLIGSMLWKASYRSRLRKVPTYGKVKSSIN